MPYLLSLMVLLLLGGCSTLRVTNDHDPGVDLASRASYAMLHDRECGDPLKQQRVERALKREMAQKGYREAEPSAADFLLVFHVDVRTRTQIETTYEHLGYFPYTFYPYYVPMHVPVSRSYTYTEEQLVVDAMLPEEKRVVWRGTATDRERDFKTPEARIGYVDGVVGKIMQPFPAAGSTGVTP